MIAIAIKRWRIDDAAAGHFPKQKSAEKISALCVEILKRRLRRDIVRTGRICA